MRTRIHFSDAMELKMLIRSYCSCRKRRFAEVLFSPVGASCRYRSKAARADITSCRDCDLQLGAFPTRSRRHCSSAENSHTRRSVPYYDRMKISWSIILATPVALHTALAAAQTGTLDQSSYGETHGWNADNVTFQWQQEVQIGMPGYLEGLNIDVAGTSGCDFSFSLYRGEGPGTGKAAFTTLVVKSAPDEMIERIFVDTTRAALQFEAGDFFTFAAGGDEEDSGGCDIQGGQDNPYPAGVQWSDLEGDFTSFDSVDINFESYMLSTLPPLETDAGVPPTESDSGTPDAVDAGLTDVDAGNETAEDAGAETTPASNNSGSGCRVSQGASVPSDLLFSVIVFGMVLVVRHPRRRTRTNIFVH